MIHRLHHQHRFLFRLISAIQFRKVDELAWAGFGHQTETAVTPMDSFFEVFSAVGILQVGSGLKFFSLGRHG